mmetsp:Transcript_5766/g.14907  ORF Transcript_5766/g.14907 Transcript_5766/m.14907 type:complete len:270 (-) Transcript_5766:3-812(-)
MGHEAVPRPWRRLGELVEVDRRGAAFGESGGGVPVRAHAHEPVAEGPERLPPLVAAPTPRAAGVPAGVVCAVLEGQLQPGVAQQRCQGVVLLGRVHGPGIDGAVAQHQRGPLVLGGTEQDGGHPVVLPLGDELHRSAHGHGPPVGLGLGDGVATLEQGRLVQPEQAVDAATARRTQQRKEIGLRLGGRHCAIQRAALDDRAGVQRPRVSAHQVLQHRCAARALSGNGDALAVATEEADEIAHPFQRHTLVLDAKVAHGALGAPPTSDLV